MLGAIDAAPKPRKPVAQKVQKKKVGVLERPVELHNTEDQEKQETDRNMEEMWEVGTAACRLMTSIGRKQCLELQLLLLNREGQE